MAPLLSNPYDFWVVPTFKREVSKFHDNLTFSSEVTEILVKQLLSISKQWLKRVSSVNQTLRTNGKKILLKQSSDLINVMGTLHQGNQQLSTVMANLNSVVQTPITLNALIAQNH